MPRKPLQCAIRILISDLFVSMSLLRQKLHISKGKGLYAYRVSFWKVCCNSGVSPISQHLVLFILFDLLLELPASLVCI